MTYGYARVSTREQNEARQIDALTKIGVDKIFLDKMSGKNFDRPEWSRLIDTLKAGDTLYMLSLDRMGRDYKEVQIQWRIIVDEIRADIIILDMPILNTKAGGNGLTGKFISDMVLQILAYVSQMEREKNRERQAQGIEAAKARGVRFGRPPIVMPENTEEVFLLCYARMLQQKEGAEMLGLKFSTFHAHYQMWRHEYESSDHEEQDRQDSRGVEAP